MNPNNNIPIGHISVDDAVKLIKQDSRQNPIVDMDYLIQHIVWLDRNGEAKTFRIPKVRRLKPEEVYKTRTGKIVDYETTGEANVFINTPFERELLKQTIRDKYREEVGHEYQAKTVRAFSTVADDAQGTNAVRPRANTKPIAKEGASIGDGGMTTSNGDFAV